jgi:hypothetical protein
VSILFDPENTKIVYKYTQVNPKHFKHRPMPTDFEQHSEYATLAQQAFAMNSYAPSEATLSGAAKNLARLHTPALSAISASNCPAPGKYDELLKRLADV